jgi:hypothetical protein
VDLTPYIPQIITAIATLGGVVLTLIFTGRRESQRVAQQLAFEREKLLADERRQLFIRTAHSLQRMRELLQDRQWAEDNGSTEDWFDAVTNHADELFKLETEIQLLAPTLTEAVRAATQIARSIRDTASVSPGISDSEERRLLDGLVRQTRVAMIQMRSILRTEAPNDRQLTAAEQAARKEPV